MRLSDYFRLMHEQHASDLYVTANAPVKLRVDGQMRSAGEDAVSAKEVEAAPSS